MCRIYGVTENLQCPKSPMLVSTITPIMADELVMDEMRGDRLISLSNDYVWQEQ